MRLLYLILIPAHSLRPYSYTNILVPSLFLRAYSYTCPQPMHQTILLYLSPGHSAGHTPILVPRPFFRPYYNLLVPSPFFRPYPYTCMYPQAILQAILLHLSPGHTPTLVPSPFFTLLPLSPVHTCLQAN